MERSSLTDFSTKSSSYDELKIKPDVEPLQHYRNNTSSINLGFLKSKNQQVIIEIPVGFEEDPVCQTMIWYLGSHWVNSDAKSTLLNKAHHIRIFLITLMQKSIHHHYHFQYSTNISFILQKTFIKIRVLVLKIRLSEVYYAL
ncbi:hypothetical protein [Pseudoalteromonas maricaloris]|uniref:hypothetical protein n=1 Tax=Pseudoalteromonas maricaloris TaxID=184924 RepID=UPI003C2A7B56